MQEASQVFVRELNKLNRLYGVETIIRYQKPRHLNLFGDKCDGNLNSGHIGTRHADGKNRTRA